MSVFVKICGITSEEDALLAVAMGADSLGFVFAPSPRQIRPAVAADIVKRLPPEILTVGVFRDESAARVAEIVHGAGLVGAQLHGHEPPAVTREVAERVRFVIKAFPAADPGLAAAAEHRADAILVDSPSPGSGELFDWSLTEGVPPGARLMIAGGLTADNVVDAIRATEPWGVDVATGIESSPGEKDPVKLRAFLAAAKSIDLAKAPWRDPGDGPRPFDWMRDAR